MKTKQIENTTRRKLQKILLGIAGDYYIMSDGSESKAAREDRFKLWIHRAPKEHLILFTRSLVLRLYDECASNNHSYVTLVDYANWFSRYGVILPQLGDLLRTSRLIHESAFKRAEMWVSWE